MNNIPWASAVGRCKLARNISKRRLDDDAVVISWESEIFWTACARGAEGIAQCTLLWILSRKWHKKLIALRFLLDWIFWLTQDAFIFMAWWFSRACLRNCPLSVKSNTEQGRVAALVLVLRFYIRIPIPTFSVSVVIGPWAGRPENRVPCRAETEDVCA